MSEPVVHAIDDLPHTVGPEPEFSESFYYQFGDPAVGINGFVRLSNRPNEGRGERTVCLYLPDGRVVLSFDRPTFADARVFEAGGMRIVVEDPLIAHRVSFAGEVVVLADPWAMRDPKRALTDGLKAPCTIALAVRAIAPARPFSLDAHGDFTPNHYEQFVAVDGVIEIAEESIALQAHGMRDRGWGQRSWQAPRFYRWTFGSCDGFGFAAGVLGRDGAIGSGGFVWEDGAMHALEAVDVRTRYEGEGVAAVTLELVGGARSWLVSGEARNAVPLRHRRGDDVTRILETSVLWSVDGQSILGIAEYLDQLVDGEPAGIAEHDLIAR
jgi:hypothetical protein